VTGITFFKQMADNGRGGILSSLVAGIAGAAFPSIAGVANSVASALPF